MKKVLITGGFGFIGGRLSQHLETLGYKVYIASRASRKKPSWLKRGEIIQIDWSDTKSLHSACLGKDCIVHAAGMNAAECVADPTIALDFNGVASGRLAEEATSAGVKKFIYLSTAHVYNSNLSGVINEESRPQNTHPYATSKIAGEKYVIKNHKKNNMQCMIVRLANAFGAPTHGDANCWMLFVNDLCMQATTNRKIVILSASNIFRNFITLTDVCTGLEFIISRDFSTNLPKVYNIGDKSKTLIEMASIIRDTYSEIRNIDIPIVELSEKTEHKQNLEYRSKLIKSEGWHATSNFSFEIRELIEFCEAKFVCNGSI